MKNFLKDEKYKKIMIAFWITLMVAIVTFVVVFITFSQKLKSTADIGLLTINTTTSVVPNDFNGTEETSTTSDKNINEVANESLNQISNGTSGITTNTASQKEIVINNSVSANTISNTIEISTGVSSNTTEEDVEEKKELKFQAPVSGEIIVDYASDNLVYSETLEEWTTHLGIDIKANKASCVVASEEGTVKSIKTDPRYGLTITLSHSDGYETVYSNLLASDFVSVR
jgi:murein DD-endopeptidase MepM/ murein hydrolase activator NlpD